MVVKQRIMRARIIRQLIKQNDRSWNRSAVANRIADRRVIFQTVGPSLSQCQGWMPFSVKSNENSATNNIKPKLDGHPVSEEQPSLEETIKQMKGDSEEKSTNSSESIATNKTLRQLASYWIAFTDEVSKAWDELIRSGERKSINKKIHPVATKEGDAPYVGPVDVMIIEQAEQLTAWERMQKRLSKAPIIQDILTRSEQLYNESGAAKIKERVDIIREDAKEAWETSQNPWVYRVSSVYDTLTAETAESIAVKELRKLDPIFTLDEWRRDVVEHTLPIIMKWFLEGRINQLKPWLGEGVFKRLAAEMTAREKEGVQIDTHVLGIMNSEILAIEVSILYFVFSK